MSEFKSLLEKTVDYVQFQFTTIFGDLKAVEFPVKIWDDMCEGTGVDGSSLGFLSTEQSDMKVFPDFSTFKLIPWEPRVARILCDMITTEDKTYPTCPRGILRKVITDAEKQGFEYRTRPELEWYFVDSDCTPLDTGKYMDTQPFDGLMDLRRAITDDLIEMDVGLKTIHHENGPGQQEIEFTVDEALHQADNVQTAKWVAKTEAVFQNAISTFMPKPFPDHAGSGLHIHQYLTKGGINIFASDEEGISDFLRYFVGGVIEHVDAMSAILNPTTNSYKRLVPGYEAPVYKSWGVGNRTALIRIPGYEKSARVEYRATDCATNIYLTSALLLAAGLYGINRKIEPQPPTTENIDKMSIQNRKELGITQLSASLEESLSHLEGSHFVRDVLGKELVEIFIEVKRRENKEYLEAKGKGTNEERQWELERYLIRA